jgi:isoquinoline 1-oxidoreductase alpha subunit
VRAIFAETHLRFSVGPIERQPRQGQSAANDASDMRRDQVFLTAGPSIKPDDKGRTFMTTFTINGRAVEVTAEPDTPLLWVLREHLKLTGTKFGCGIAQCGACTVHVDGEPTRSCQTRLEDIAGKKVTTIEGLSANADHPLQKAWIVEQVPQCGYCQSGQIMQAAALLKKTPKPTREQIIEHMDGNICRCGTYVRIVSAIQRAAREA